MMLIDNKFELGQIVYLHTCKDQHPRLVTRINVSTMGIIYELSCGTETSTHYDYEISEKKNILISTDN